VARSAEDDARAIVRMLVGKGVHLGQPYENPTLIENGLWLGIDGPDLDSALIYAGKQGWIENGPEDTTILTAAGYAAGGGT
jgi:hypothetical protein